MALVLVLPGPPSRPSGRCRQRRRDPAVVRADRQARVAPAVVNVYASRRVAPQTSPFFADPFFRQFFGDTAGQPRVEQALGSGVIIDAERPDRHQFPRHRAGRRGQGRALRQARVCGGHRAQGRALRSGGAARSRRRRQAADHRVRQFRRGPGRRPGAGDRRSVRRRPDRDQRHRLGVRAHSGRPERRPVLHPDRCGDQSRATPAARWST